MSVSYTHLGTGKQVRVAVFAKGAKADEALAAGADIVGAEDLMERIQKENFFEFDVVIATPDMMGVVGRLGRVLGPKGLMPNPKAGTVSMDVTKACLLYTSRQAGTERGPCQSRTKVPPDGRNFLPPEVKNPRRMSPDFLHLQSKCYLMRANARKDVYKRQIIEGGKSKRKTAVTS